MTENKTRAKHISNAMLVATLLDNYIIDDSGDIRQFDIIDYYDIDKLSPGRLFEVAGKALEKLCTKEEYERFNKFALKHGDSPKITMKEIMSIKHSIMVGDELREITDEEKLEAVRFITEKGLRLSSDVYFAAVKREINGTLKFQEDENIIKNSKTLKK